MPTYQQLLIPFVYNTEEDLKIVPSFVRNFLYNTGDELGVLSRKQLQTKYDDLDKPHSITGVFPERKRPYHNLHTSENDLYYHSFFTDFLKQTQSHQATTKEKGVAVNRTRSLTDENHCHMPKYLNLEHDPESKYITCDYGFAICGRLRGNRGVIQSGPDRVRMWTHTEYERSEYEERHLIVPEKSWVAVYYPEETGEIYIKRYSAYNNFISSKALVYPWLAFSLFNSAVKAERWKTLADKIEWFLSNHVDIRLFDNTQGFDMGPLLKPMNKYNPKGHLLESFITEAAVSQNFKEFVDNLVLSKLELDNRLYPLFYKYISDNFALIDFNEISSKSIREYTALLARLVQYYEDPSILNHLPPKAFNAAFGAGHQAYYGQGIQSISLNSASVDGLLNDPLFASFERAKQYRVLASIFETRVTFLETQDLLGMLNQISLKGKNTAKEIQPRRIKDVHDYHEEAVKLYTSLRFAASPMRKELINWLTFYGNDIPGTNLAVIAPDDTNVVRAWGTQQAHCIGSYADNMARGSTLLLGVKDIETNEWKGHVQLSSFPQFFNAFNTAVTGNRAMAVQRGYQYQQNSTTIQMSQIVRDKVRENPEIVDRFFTRQIVQSAVVQFHGKRNTAVPEDVKKLTVDHIHNAMVHGIKKVYAKKEEKELEDANSNA